MPSLPVSPSDSEAAALQDILAYVTGRTGCDFTRYNRNTMSRRVLRRMIDTQSRSMVEYLDLLRTRPGEVAALVRFLTIHVSEFFRDPPVFELVACEVLPEILRWKQTQAEYSLRIWSAASASGEELYSLAMLVNEVLDTQPPQELQWTLTLLGTDLDEEALRAAGQGVFHARSMKMVPPAFRAKYFFPFGDPSAEQWRLVPQLAAMCAFQSFDLTTRGCLSPPGGVFAEYDLICCRNFFIYCQTTLKDEVFQRLHRCLRPRGFLILGKAEVLPPVLEQWYVPIDRRLRVYRKKGESRAEET
ncbi:MAG: hypothetical protein BWK76_18320 [Desulfobulbaceae bacterium A2]|nr:MAG: hypothetical protein BWK76_18320 [Desulfobulbaceae bacterium A2]